MLTAVQQPQNHNILQWQIANTVELPKRGHFGEFAFVLCREVVLFLEVLSAECVYTFFITVKGLNSYKIQKVTKKGMNRITGC